MADFEAVAQWATANLPKNTTDAEKLKLYSYYKQAKNDPSFDKAPKPGMLDFVGKAKHGAWEKIVKEGVTPEQAAEKYIEAVKEVAAAHGVTYNL